jgi:hypothetical protein
MCCSIASDFQGIIRAYSTAAAMKRTLYEVLGVAPEASAEEIAAAYRRRLEALKAAPSQDASALALTRDAYDILCDTYLRTNYDASLKRPPIAAVPAEEPADDKPGVTFGRHRWAIAAALVLAVCVTWFTLHRPTPRTSKPASMPSAASPAPAEPAVDASSEETTTRSAKDVFNEVSGSVVRISVMDATGVRLIDSLSGVVVEPDVVLTNCHVAVRGTTLAVKLRGELRPATLQMADELLNLCKLSVPGLNVPPATLGSVRSLMPGQRVVAIGASAAGEASMRDGIVTALMQVDHGTVIRTNAPIAAGWSGGGLFDFAGQLVGIATFHHAYGVDANVALPVDWLKQMRARTEPMPVAGGPDTKEPVPSLVVGRWVCFGSIPGRNGVYTFRDDGRVLVTNSEGQPSDSRYTLARRNLQFATDAQKATFNVTSFSPKRMVWEQGGAEKRVVCDRR